MAKPTLPKIRQEFTPQVIPDQEHIASLTDPSIWQQPLEDDYTSNDMKRSEPPSETINSAKNGTLNDSFRYCYKTTSDEKATVEADSDNPEQPQQDPPEDLPNEPSFCHRRKRTSHYPKYSHHVSQVFGSNMKAVTARLRAKNFQKRNIELCQTPKLSARELKRRVEELEAREAELKNERRELQRLRQSAGESLKRARQKEMEITKLQDEVTSKFDSYKKKEMKLLEKQRGEVQRKLRQLSLVPVKEERDKIAALERELQEERERHEREEARLKASVSSVRKSNAQLQARVKQQKEEISRLRQARLEAWGSAGNVDALPLTKVRGLYNAKAAKMLYSNSYINSSRTKRKPRRGSAKPNCQIISSHTPTVRKLPA